MYGAFEYMFHGLNEWESLELEEEQAAGLLAIEYRDKPTRAWILQYQVTEGFAAVVDPFDAPAHEFYLGWKNEFFPGRVLELGIIENAFLPDNSPDFGLHAGISYRF